MQATVVGLPDGRGLEIGELGPDAGMPVLYFHGAVGSPLRRCPATERAVRAAGVRLIMVSRPGFGASDPVPGRALADWPADVLALADALGLDRFAVLGVSAGGPYAAACGWALPARVIAAAIVSGTVPLWGEEAPAGRSREQRWACRAVRRPRLSRAVAGSAVAAARRRPGTLIALAERRAADAAVVDGFLAATERGIGGMLDDARIALGPWDFPPEAVACEVHLWHGARDATVPVRHALAVAARLPSCHTTVLLDEGHFFLRRRMVEILGALQAAGSAQHARRPAA